MNFYSIFLISIISISGIYHQLAIILCIFFIFFYIRYVNITIVESVIKKLFIFSSLLIIIGSINSSKIFLLIEEMIKVIVFAMFLITVKNTINKKLFNDVVFGLSYVIILSLLLYPFLLHAGRFSSIFAHPNHLAYVINLLIFCQLIIVNENNRKLFHVVFLTVILFLTNSSGGILCYFGIMLTKSLLSKNKSFYLIVFLVGVMFAILFKDSIPGINIIFEKFYSIDTDELQRKIAMFQFGNDSSLVWRITYWSALLRQLFSDSLLALLFGYGAGTMSYGNYLFYWMFTDPHNDFVRVILQYGFIGFFVFSTYLFLIVKKYNIGVYIIPLLLLPMLVGNIIVNVPFIILFSTILASSNFIYREIYVSQNSNCDST